MEWRTHDGNYKSHCTVRVGKLPTETRTFLAHGPDSCAAGRAYFPLFGISADFQKMPCTTLRETAEGREQKAEDGRIQNSRFNIQERETLETKGIRAPAT